MAALWQISPCLTMSVLHRYWEIEQNSKTAFSPFVYLQSRTSTQCFLDGWHTGVYTLVKWLHTAQDNPEKTDENTDEPWAS